jgi:hypothetical protein
LIEFLLLTDKEEGGLNRRKNATGQRTTNAISATL